MQIMTKINDFEEIFFEGSIIFHIFAHEMGACSSLRNALFHSFYVMKGDSPFLWQMFFLVPIFSE